MSLGCISVILNVVRLHTVMLNVIRLSVVAPSKSLDILEMLYLEINLMLLKHFQPSLIFSSKALKVTPHLGWAPYTTLELQTRIEVSGVTNTTISVIKKWAK
jgi:hypothetical protein